MVESLFLNNTWIEISESAYAQNLGFFRKLIGKGTELSAVVKANAYGHGWQSIARLAAKHGADSFCVHSIDEAQRLRRAGFRQNVLIMGPIPLRRLREAVEENYRFVVYNHETLRALHRLDLPQDKLARIHLKLETGTHRQGIAEADLAGFLTELKATRQVLLEAVYTHFADIEDTTNYDYSAHQRASFDKLVDTIKTAGFPIIRRHAACTAAAILFPETHFEMVRLGIGQYGLWPSRETMVSFQEQTARSVKDALRPVLTWKTRLNQIKTVPADSSVGYGRTYKTTRETRLGILPIGYSDGYDRGLSNQGYILVRGKRAPVRGRICMNLMMIDLSDIPEAQLDDEAVLIGRQGKEEITADQLAALCGTINYEIVARLNPEIPRLVVG